MPAPVSSVHPSIRPSVRRAIRSWTSCCVITECSCRPFRLLAYSRPFFSSGFLLKYIIPVNLYCKRTFSLLCMFISPYSTVNCSHLTVFLLAFRHNYHIADTAGFLESIESLFFFLPESVIITFVHKTDFVFLYMWFPSHLLMPLYVLTWISLFMLHPFRKLDSEF